MRRPRVRADYRPVRRSAPAGDYLVVVGETRHLLIEDPVAAELAGRLDGRTETTDVLEALAESYPRRRVAAALRRLTMLGLLADGATAAPDAAAAAWDARGVDPDEAGRPQPVHLVDAGAPDFAALEAQLLGLGAKPGDDGPAVVVVRDPADPRLQAFNAARLADGRGWTMIRPHGTVLLIGPHFLPGETGCWECLRRRWTENQPVLAYLEHTVDPARASIPATVAVAAGLLAAELPVLAAHGRSPRLTGRLVTYDTVALTGEGHDLVRQPHCPACGSPPDAGARIELAPSPVTVSADGGSRAAAAETTYRRLAHHVDRYLGVVNRLEPMEDYHNGLTYSYGAGHNFALPRGPAMLRTNLRGLSGGKGRTEVQAKVSAIGEAIERYAGVWRGDRAVLRAAWPEVAHAVHPRDLLLFSEAQYAAREPRGHFHRVPSRLADDQPIDWTAAWSLTFDEPRALPAAYCWYGHPDLVDADVCGADSNGCAAGASLEEAILQGLCELVERDAVALWWYHRSRLPGVDLASFADPWIDALCEFYPGRLGRGLWALDLTADLGVAVYAAVSPRLDRPVEDVLVGFGAHPDPAVALGRALAEVNQFLPMVARRDGERTRYAVSDAETLAWFTTVRVAEQPWLSPADGPLSSVHTHRSWASGDAAADVRHLVGTLREAGLDTIVLDQSRADLGLRVARVVVPGLRHFWRRLGPGRLWDAPARLGRTGLAPDEAAMNPLSVFF
ncbi:TOMM precursor leader peptide-binding protein [Dactylosporangium sp. CA-233914]|uniref:TOMM precursor leader peptide-binding protein n=1 Tax=Dactylosporangium sp. CA-233914 TaxID=3239934 RepID=UPI003D8C2431